MGFEVTPLPTALLSCHTQYPEFTFLDLTAEMRKIIANWKSQGFKFNAFYTGYLGSPEQVQVVSELIQDFRRPSDLIVVDPVLGDNGKLYKGMTEEMVGEMRNLIKLADVITPNITEMFLLLGESLEDNILLNGQWSMVTGQRSLSGAVSAKDAGIDLAESRQNRTQSTVNEKTTFNDQTTLDAALKGYLRRLSDAGPSIVIVTSVPVIDNPHLTSVYAYNRNGNRYWKVTCPFLPAHYPGTGDSFTSVITGSLLQGDSLPLALDRAMQFTLQGIRSTFGYDYSNLDGIMLEKVLSNLHTPIQVSSFELI